jgi:hypothetical protein
MFVRLARLSAVVLAAVLASGSATWAHARTLTIVLDGTLGPVISGSDPAGLDGQSATVTITAKESLTPYKMTAKSASYHIPAGSITVLW